MLRPPTCHQLPSGSDAPRDSRLRIWSIRASSNILNGMDFTRWPRMAGVPAIKSRTLRQAGCMAKVEKRRKTQRLPKQIDVAVNAAEDKKALDLVVLDLRKA